MLPIILANQPAVGNLEGPMENLADLMERLLEIQSGERRSPKLIEEDERLMRSLQERRLAGKPTQKLELSENRAERGRIQA
jgi:hypothetical protein